MNELIEKIIGISIALLIWFGFSYSFSLLYSTLEEIFRLPNVPPISWFIVFSFPTLGIVIFLILMEK